MNYGGLELLHITTQYEDKTAAVKLTWYRKESREPASD